MRTFSLNRSKCEVCSCSTTHARRAARRLHFEPLEDRRLLSAGGFATDALAQKRILLVDADAPGNNDGSSWAHAYTDLQSALAVADGGDQVRVAQGVYTPAGPGGDDRTASFQLIDGLELVGGYAGFGEADPNARDVHDYETVLSGDLAGNDGPNFAGDYENSYHVVTAGSDVGLATILDGLTITAGNAYDRNGGGFYSHGGGLTVRDCTFRENRAQGDDSDGGGFYTYEGSSTFTDCLFVGNSAGDSGGGISSYSGDMVLTNCTFRENASHSRDGTGGGFRNYEGHSTLIDCLFVDNLANSDGGGAAVNSGDAIVSNCTFRGNRAQGEDSDGGGFRNYRGHSTLIDCQFVDNLAGDDGGGVAVHDGESIVSDCTFLRNRAAGHWGDGGGLRTYSGKLTVTNCTFYANSSGGQGGGFHSFDGHSTLIDCQFVDNLAGNDGGGVTVLYGDSIVSNCTFSTNASGHNGGGICTYTGNPAVINCTFYANSAARQGGGAYDQGGQPTIVNSILWNNSDAGGTGESAQISTHMGDPQVSYSCVQGLNGFAGNGNIADDPLLRDPAADDLRLQDDSPCIGAGDNAAVPPDVLTDLDGFPRIIGTVDMGAYEWQLLYFVDVDATGSNDGTSWAHAYTDLQSALVVANAGDQVRVAQGVYTPAGPGGGDRTASFQLIDGVQVVGGYAGFGEADPYARDVDAYETVLSGDLAGNDGPDFAGDDENSYHVLTAGSDVGLSTVLDGLTITGANAGARAGGGVYSRGGLTVRDCTFRGNRTESDGGGFWTYDGSSTFTDCLFVGNSAGDSGGGISSYSGDMVLTNCTFRENAALGRPGTGGGFRNYEGHSTLIDCLFVDNLASFWGGGVAVTSGSSIVSNCTFLRNQAGGRSSGHGGGLFAHHGESTITNSTFSFNASGHNGGGIWSYYDNPAVINCTFYANSSGRQGGGFYHEEDQPTIVNSIFWNNSDAGGTGESAQISTNTGNPQVSYCSVQGLDDFAGNGNIGDDPLLRDPSANDLRLQAHSPCIDAGDNAAVGPGVVTDLDGNPRIDGGTVDMGAYEAQVIYVDVDAPGNNDGTSWADAYTDLQSALAAAPSGNQVRVAQGVYRPAGPDGDRTATFQLVNGLIVAGGYAGFGEANPNARDIDAYKTILSGDLAGDDGPEFTGNEENSYHVTTGSGTDATAVLDGLTITAGNVGEFHDNAGAGMFNDRGSPTLIGCTFTANYAGDDDSRGLGGGMFNFYSSPTLTDCDFIANVASSLDGSDGSGGGMFNTASNLVLSNCTFEGNTSGRDGGGMSNDDSTLVLTNCTFTDNVVRAGGSGSYGGGMSNSESSPVLTDCTFTGNSAAGQIGSGGGAMFNGDESWPLLTGCEFVGNYISGNGGDGGAILNHYGRPTLIDCTFTGNSASSGGAMANRISAAIVTGGTFAGNSAISGGAMANVQSSPLVTDCLFVGNSAEEYGGGMANFGGSPTLINCLFSGNLSNDYGGAGMCNEEGSTPVLTHCTFSGNVAGDVDFGGGGIFNASGSPVLTDCILWGNTDNVNDTEAAQISTRHGTPLIDYSCVEGWTGRLGGIGNIGADPLLADPDGDDDVVGTRDDNLRLTFGSSCIDAGTDAGVYTDVDGNVRPYDVREVDNNGPLPEFDMGAYEYVYGTIRGSKFHDLDADGVWDHREPGLPGWTIYLDSDDDGQLDPAEIRTVTGADGEYALTQLPAGDYTVAEVRQPGWEQTFPTSVSSGQLAFVQAILDGQTDGQGNPVDGLNGAFSVAVSPDGAHVYVATMYDGTLLGFRRDPSTGELILVQSIEEAQARLNQVESVAVSPDGNHVYIVEFGPPRLTAFSRDPATGVLTLVEVLENGGTDGHGNPIGGLRGATFVSLSPDGRHVYTTAAIDDGLSVFHRDPATGRLTFVQEIGGLNGGRSATVSPDGRHVYATASNDDALAVFQRDLDTGRLTPVELLVNGQPDGQGNTVDGLDWVCSVVVSPDGSRVYAAGRDGHALTTLARNQSTGRLTFVESLQDGQTDGSGNPIDGLNGARSVVVSPDGNHVYVAAGGDDAVAVFRHDGPSGQLSFVESLVNGHTDHQGNPIGGLNGATSIAICPRGGSVYVAASGGGVSSDSAVAVFRRHADPAGSGSHFVTLDAGQTVADVDFGNRELAGPLDHFTFSAIASPQYADVPFDVTLTAVDEQGRRLTGFDGRVELSGWIDDAVEPTIVLSEIDVSLPDTMEFTNVSGQEVDISGWQVLIYDRQSGTSPQPALTIPGGTACPADGVFLVQQDGDAPGRYPHFFTGGPIDWQSEGTTGVLLLDEAGEVVDFMAAAALDPAAIRSPLTVVPDHWQGPQVVSLPNQSVSYQRIGNADQDHAGDWVLGVPSIGQINLGLTSPFAAGASRVAVSPTAAVLVDGVWTGEVTVLEPAAEMYLLADDGSAHLGQSNTFDVEPQRPDEIRGSKFKDLDGDGIWDRGEPGLAGWTIYVDLDRDGELDHNEPSVITGHDGHYAIADLPPGEYAVAEVPRHGWEQTFPAAGSHTVVVGLGQIIEGVDFGNRLITDVIYGSKFDDLDGDGIWDTEEPGLPDWKIYLDENENGQWDAGEPFEMTGADGQYAFTGLAPGAYTVAEVAQDGWQQTFPQIAEAGNELVSRSWDGSPLSGRSRRPSITADGRYVAFASYADNLVPQDTDGQSDAFVYDRQTGTMQRVSEAADGTPANDVSHGPNISADGRYVVFESDADNLVPGDTNNHRDVFVRDLETGTLQRVSVTVDGRPSDAASYNSSISAHGRWVAFRSLAGNFVPGDTNRTYDIFVYDRQTGTTERVSLSSDGAQANDACYDPAISADGRYVAFHSAASNLVPGDDNGYGDVFVYDRHTDTIQRVSVSSDGSQGNGGSGGPSISADGRYVTFESEASTLVPGDTNGDRDIFVYDRHTYTIRRVSVASDGSQANHDCYLPSASVNGRYVSFYSGATNLVPGDTNDADDVFVYDLQTKTLDRASVAFDGSQANDASFYSAVSSVGPYVAIMSKASNLMPGGDANPEYDIFVRRMPSTGLPGTQPVVLDPDQAVEGVDFGNRLITGAIRGAKFNDLDGDGVRSRHEPGLAGWTIYADLDGDGRLDGDEPSAVTGPDGRYVIAGVPPGSHNVAEVHQADWQQTFPAEGSHRVIVHAGQVVEDVDFGNWTNYAPVAEDDFYDTDEDTPLVIADVLANDTDLNGDALTARWVGGPEHGTLEVLDGGRFRYTPQADYHGPDGFTYKAFDGIDDSHAATVHITVLPVNDQPIAHDDFYNALSGETLRVGQVEIIPASHVYWADSDGKTIGRANLDGSEAVDVFRPTTHPDSIAVDPAGQMLYWALGPADFKIYRSAMDGSAAEVLVTIDEVPDCWGNCRPRVTDLALDTVGGKIYWPSYELFSTPGKIWRANLDGSDPEVIVGGLVEPHALDLDLAAAKVYWSDRQGGRVQRANLDGSRVETLVAELDGPVGLALDVLEEKVYWIAGGVFSSTPVVIQRANLDGSGAETVYNAGAGWAQGLALDPLRRKLYWADSQYDTINRVNFDGSEAEVLVTDGLVNPYGITLDSGVATGDSLSLVANDLDPDGDLLSVSLVEGPSHGTLSLEPDGSFEYTSQAGFAGTDRFTYKLNDGTVDSNVATVEIQVTGGAASVVDRHVFYNNSAFDGDDPAANAEDDNAIAPDKQALLPGQTAGFVNYTSYSRGVNGIMIDVLGLAGTPTADDFTFKVGNGDHTAGWDDAPAPLAVTVRPGQGVDGSDRITLIWEDGAVAGQWLRVTVLAGAETGLAEDDVFYFGNAIGECGNSTSDANVNALDMLAARDNPRTFLDPAPIDFFVDHNRDARVNAIDMLIARENQTHFLNALKLITAPAADAAMQRVAAQAAEAPQPPPGKLDWLYHLTLTSSTSRSSDNNVDPVEDGIARLLAAYWR